MPRSLAEGGAEMTLARLLSALGERVEAHVAAERGVRGHEIPLPEATRLHPMPALKAGPVQWYRRLSAVLSAVQPDVVHTFAPLPGALVRLALLRRREVAIFHREPSPWWAMAPPVRWANRLTYRRNDRAYAVSKVVWRSMSTGAQRKTEVLYHGIDGSQVAGEALSREDARDQLGINASAIALVSVGSFKPAKGFDRLPLVAAPLLDSASYDTWHVFGGGPLRGSIQKQIRAAGLGDRVVFHGHVPNAAHLLRAFDVYVGLSHSEGLPVAVLEADSLNLPSVVAPYPGVDELVDLCNNVAIAPDRDPRVVATCIGDSLRAQDPGRTGALDSQSAVDIGYAAELLLAAYGEYTTRDTSRVRLPVGRLLRRRAGES